ncbi:MAG TPA: 2-amino-4-hydroxy-6-hydroxymethyldihydropteridine diphosphokinase [Balneolales bacterium]|nr:2-amino-4-hydroxy-6-hydroxymethyldihydropteridine diphosphokinase [Balneolales bacterium]
MMANHRVIISIGSNIDPEKNVKRALQRLEQIVKVRRKSTFTYTKPLIFKDQPEFLNGVVLVETSWDKEELDQQLKVIEKETGRIRTLNKNGPRTIDLDIIIFDGKVVDNDYYEREFLRQFVKEIT